MAGGAMAAGALGACASAGSRRERSRTRRLVPVRITPSLVRRIDVGFRPYRPAGFVVRVERLDEKTVVHNYGHGGAGITLSRGTAVLATRLVAEAAPATCAVLGCGAVGLASARLLQGRGLPVTIYARDVPPNTTSNVAAAQWAPYSLVDEDGETPEFERTLLEAARLSLESYLALDPGRYGIRRLENYVLSDRPPRFPWSVDVVSHLFDDLEDLVPADNPFGTQYARRFRTLQIDTGVYLAALVEDFTRAGGRIVRQDLRGPADVAALSEDVVVNCTGLGARDLFGDQELTPVKGQLTVLEPQLDVDYVVIAGGLYMMPRSDGILLGGTFERGIDSLEPNESEAERIFAGHQALFARLATRGDLRHQMGQNFREAFHES